MHSCLDLCSGGETKQIGDTQRKEVHQVWCKHLGEKENERGSEKEGKQHAEELHTFENMSILDSDEKSNNVSLCEEGEIWNEGSDENLNLNLKYSSTQIKNNPNLSLI